MKQTIVGEIPHATEELIGKPVRFGIEGKVVGKVVDVKGNETRLEIHDEEAAKLIRGENSYFSMGTKIKI